VATTAPAEAAPAADAPAAPAAPAKGLGIAPGVKRPGAKKTEAAPAAEAAHEATPAPAAETGNGAAEAPPAQEPAKGLETKGLGIAKGARPPGKRS